MGSNSPDSAADPAPAPPPAISWVRAVLTMGFLAWILLDEPIRTHGAVLQSVGWIGALVGAGLFARRAARRGHREAEIGISMSVALAGWLVWSLCASLSSPTSWDAPHGTLAVAYDALAVAGLVVLGFGIGGLARLAFLPIRSNPPPTDHAP